MTSFVLGGGCFWCLDAVYRRLIGVTEVESGYAGGDDDSPNYYRVATGATGHAEVTRVTFDESEIPAEVILDIFFLIHDPTTLNRQGADEGTQYRSIMLHSSEDERKLFVAAAAKAQSKFDNPIVTQIEPLAKFYPAEDEHQDYFSKNPAAGYCSVIVAPKVSKARKNYTRWFQSD